MVDYTSPDILIVGAIVLIAIIFLIILFISWLREERIYKAKRKEVEQGAKSVEESSLLN